MRNKWLPVQAQLIPVQHQNNGNECNLVLQGILLLYVCITEVKRFKIL